MSWKQALLVGGSIFVLAACADSTAPQPQLRQVGAPRAAAKGPKGGEIPVTLTIEECRSGYSVSSGRECGAE